MRGPTQAPHQVGGLLCGGAGQGADHSAPTHIPHPTAFAVPRQMQSMYRLGLRLALVGDDLRHAPFLNVSLGSDISITFPTNHEPTITIPLQQVVAFQVAKQAPSDLSKDTVIFHIQLHSDRQPSSILLQAAREQGCTSFLGGIASICEPLVEGKWTLSLRETGA
jgi:hypothetical protein